MDQRNRNAMKRPFEILFSAALVLILLTACGGGDEEDSATETAETIPSDGAATPGSDRAPADVGSESVLASPAVDAAVPAGTPTGTAGTPTPAIVGSAPRSNVPAGSATPADLTGVATPVALAPDVPVTGDGTGGGAPGTAGAERPDSDALVDSCDVASFPPYSGDAPVQVTTVDVNFRAGPGTDCDALGEPVAAGTAVDVLSDPVTREGEPDLTWVAVSIDGTQGWLASDFLEPAE